MYDEIRNPANGTLGGVYNPIERRQRAATASYAYLA